MYTMYARVAAVAIIKNVLCMQTGYALQIRLRTAIGIHIPIFLCLLIVYQIELSML